MAGTKDGVVDLRTLEAVGGLLERQTIGNGAMLRTPFGLRRCVYADFTASGRALQPIESYIQEQVLPLYGNVHSQSTSTARQSSYFRDEAREIVRNALRGSHEDAIIFAGSGATGAAAAFVNILRSADFVVGADHPDLEETRWHSFVCRTCDNLQLENESCAKAHINTLAHKRRSATQRPKPRQHLVLFLLDPTLHHSSLLPFRNLRNYQTRDRKVQFAYRYMQTVDTQVDVNRLRLELELIARDLTHTSATVMCVLNGCSNVTGCKANFKILNDLIRCFDGQRQGVSFVNVWDMASALGACEIDLTRDGIDVAFLSPHKLLGGPDTSGILCIKKRFLTNDVPGCAGGGVVRFVSKHTSLYTFHREEREEAGTPNIVACIRTGMVFKFASLIPVALAALKEAEYMNILLNAWSREKRIQLLGPVVVPRIASSGAVDVAKATQIYKEVMQYRGVRKGVVSFMIKYGNELTRTSDSERSVTPVGDLCELVSYPNVLAKGGLYLHHNFVSAVLNDVFGIQARPGCACAGPLAHELIGLNDAHQTEEYLRCLEETGMEILRPGFVRISINYTMNIDNIDLIAHAVGWVAQFGWKLLPYYTYHPASGEWSQNVIKPDKFRLWLSDMFIGAEGLVWKRKNAADVGLDAVVVKKDGTKIPGAVATPGMVATMNIMKEVLAKRKVDSASILAQAGKGREKSQERKPLVSCEEPASADRDMSVHTPARTTVPHLPKGKVVEEKTRSVAELRKKLESGMNAPVKSSVKALANKFEQPSPSVQRPPFTRAKTLGLPKLADFVPRLKNGRRGSHEGLGKDEPELAVTPAIVKPKILESKPSPVPSEPAVAEEPVADDFTNNDLLTNDAVKRLLVNSQMEEAPLELQEYNDRAHELVSVLLKGKAGSLCPHNKHGWSPALPAAFAHLIWFALPGDAVYALNLFGKGTSMPNDGEPAVATDPSHIGYPIWVGGSVSKPPTRSVHSPFEVTQYRPKLEVDKILEPMRTPLNVESEHEIHTWLLNAVVDTLPELDSISDAVTSESQVFERATIVSVRKRTVGDEPEAVEATGVVEMEVCSDEPKETEPVVADMPAETTLSEADELTPGKDPSSSSLSSGSPSSRSKIPRGLRRKVGDALRQFDMIQTGDRILVGLSGGKDSLTMLNLLLDLQKRSPVKFEIGVATVNPLTLEYDPTPLIPYVRDDLHLPYHMLEYPIMELAKEKMEGDSLCAFCARMKRGLLYSCMKENGYNKLALGQHLDDVAESFLMSAFYNGSLNTMKANYKTTAKDYSADGSGEDKEIHIIRPLVFVRERELAQYAADNKLPVIADNCPACFKAPKERLRIKHLLAAQEFDHPMTISNIKKAILPLLSISDTDRSRNVIMPGDECGGMCPLR